MGGNGAMMDTKSQTRNLPKEELNVCVMMIREHSIRLFAQFHQT